MTDNKLLFSHFIEVLPPSKNQRVGRRRGGGAYVSAEYKEYEQAMLRYLRMDLGREKYTLPPKSLYRIDLMFLGDWYDSLSMIRVGNAPRKASPNLGEDRSDLDNLFKVAIDAVKKFVKNDDKFTNEIHGYKIQWPKTKGTIITVYKTRLYELDDIEQLGVPKEVIERVRNFKQITQKDLE